jgi:hypothetical protein
VTQPVAPGDVADLLTASLLALEQALSARAKAAWYRMSLQNMQGSFTGDFMPAVLPDVVTAQTTAARLGSASVTAMNPTAPPDAPQVVPEAFAGGAGDGRPLDSLLARPLVQTYVDLDAGVPLQEAMDRGFDSLDLILSTNLQDTSRSAAQVQMVTHRVTYYIRQVEPNACSRCVILSGKHYKVNAGFLRHPGCRCVHVPGVAVYEDPVDGSGRGRLVSESDAGRTPEEVFAALSREEQDRTFTAAGAQAIRDGARIAPVVNARRSGMSTVTDQYGTKYRTTTVGAKPGQTRLLPEACYQVAGGDHDEAIRLLKANGYIVD